MNNEIVISVNTITYNHEKYIAQAIEGVLAQKCSYKIEMIISDDCSTDNTPAIIKKYAELYPDIIKPTFNATNIGMQKNSTKNTNACTGHYAASLDGDDYWTDPYKLQKQVDFLEKHPDYSMCFTAIEVLNELGNNYKLQDAFQNFTKDTYTIEDYILAPADKPILIPVPTLVYRNSYIPLPDFYEKALTGDVAATLLFFSKGKAKFINEKTAVYREHLGGVSKSKEFKFKLDRSLFDLFDNFNEYSNHKYHDLIKQRLFPISKTLLMYGSGILKGKERRTHILRMIKGYNKYKSKANLKEILYYNTVLFFPFLIKFYKYLKMN